MIIAVIAREKASLDEPAPVPRLFTVSYTIGRRLSHEPQAEDAMNETACLLLIGGAALLMASTLLRLPPCIRIAVTAVVLLALSAAEVDPIAVKHEFTIAALT